MYKHVASNILVNYSIFPSAFGIKLWKIACFKVKKKEAVSVVFISIL